jgi:hypothetical protein
VGRASATCPWGEQRHQGAYETVVAASTRCAHVDYEGMQVEILELFAEARRHVLPKRMGWRCEADPRELTRFATIERASRRSLDDRRNRKMRRLLQANVEARAARAEAALREAYAATFTAAEARLRGPRAA